MTQSGSTCVLYIDGIAVGTNTSMTLNPSNLGSSTQNYIGKSQWNDPDLTGSVDDFRIYARALSGGEIAALASFVPPSPAGLATVAGNGRTTLLWSPASGATSYNVKRSTTSGSGYAPVTTVTTPQWVNTGLANGTPYYYLVSAVSAAGESADSAEVSVTPNAGAATALIWSGAVNGTWDTATANWLNAGAAASFVDGYTALFADAGANATINLSASRAPGIAQFQNTTVNFTVGGSPIVGTGSLIKSGLGLLTLSGANTFSGGTTLNDGQITLGTSSSGSGNAVTSGPLGRSTVTLGGGKLQMNAKTLGNNLSAATGTTTIIDNTGGDGYLDGNLSGSGTVTLQNSSGGGLSLKIAQNATVNWGGFAGTLNYYAANGQVFNVFMPNSCDLSHATLNSGGNGTPPGSWSSLRFGTGTTRIGALSGSFGYMENAGTLEIGNLNSDSTFGGVLLSGSLTKVGTGTQTLTGANSYPGPTTLNAGKLLITTVSAANGNYTVANSATLGVTNVSSGSAAVANLTVAAGSALEFQKVSSTTIPLIVASNVTVSGSCTVTIIGASDLVAGNSYPLVGYAGALSGAFTNLQLQMPYGWRGTLTQVGKQFVLANVAVVATTPPSLTPTPGNQQLQLAWPATHTGWQLEAQTNSQGAGLGANWFPVFGSTGTNQLTLPITTLNSSVFFRLVYP